MLRKEDLGPTAFLMVSDDKLVEIVEHFLLLNKNSLHGYYCKNDVQELNRLSCFYEDFEIQINEIVHSKVPHCHGSCMTSLILHWGYNWFLRQAGADITLELFAPVGSIIRMGPLDSHWIPETKSVLKSISLCVFRQKSDWHEYYPKLDKETFDRIYWVAYSQLKSWLSGLKTKKSLELRLNGAK